ncbi:MAG: hypothetical protein ACRDO2_06870 [Nocardioidaceae bacterium]
MADARFRTITHGPDGLPYYVESAQFVDTWTNVDTGEFVTDVRSYRDPALRVTDNGDGTLTILVKGTGHHVMYDQDGQPIARFAGQRSFELLFDHAGTPTDPDDDELLAFLGVIKSVGHDDGFWDALVQAIG